MVRLAPFAFVLLTAASSVAGDVSRRDFQSIQNALDAINSQLLRMNIAFAGLENGSAAAFRELEATSTPLVQNATRVIEASEPLSYEDSEELATATDALRSNLNVTVIQAIQHKPMLDALNLSSVLLQGFESQRAAGVQLTVALNSKLAAGAQNVLVALTQVDGTFQDGIAFFSGADPGLASQLPQIPPLNATASTDLSPVTIQAPASTVPGLTLGEGVVNVDGSCACAVDCSA